MNDRQLESAGQLADVLEQENEALKRLDFPAAVMLLPAKVKALEELTTGPMPAVMPTGPWQRLGRLAAENQALLERAIAVQTRIVMIVARASAATPSVAIGYNGHGSGSATVRAAAMALSTRA